MKTLRELRKEYKMTQLQLARKLNLNAATISRWENGHTPIREKHITKLCEFFGERVYALEEIDDAGKSLTKIIPNEYLRILKDYRLTGIVEFLLECDADDIEQIYKRIGESR